LIPLSPEQSESTDPDPLRRSTIAWLSADKPRVPGAESPGAAWNKNAGTVAPLLPKVKYRGSDGSEVLAIVTIS
jgi:hypothetical protein